MKSAFSNCKSCSLYSKPQVIGECNVENLSDVKLIVLTEYPLHEDVKQNKILSGKDGKYFRKAFEDSGLSKYPYLITNVVLCYNVDENGKIKNLDSDVVNSCSPNWKKVLELCENATVLIMGNNLKSIFNIDGKITDCRGQFYKKYNKDVFLTFHPNYILKAENKKYIYDIIKDDFDLLANHLMEKTADIKLRKMYEGKIYSYKLPEWCYSEDICLFDVQRIFKTKEILYIFRNKKGEKLYYRCSDEDYYHYHSKDNANGSQMIRDVSETNLIIDKPSRDQNVLPGTYYEGDIRTELKHVIDYRYVRKSSECYISLKIMYADIEVFSNGSRKFPDPKEAPSPINAISFKIDSEKTNIYLCSLKEMQNINPIIPENTIVKIFKTERDLLYAFCEKIREENPDIICGWNFLGFDMITIYNRMRKLSMDVNLLSPIGLSHINQDKYGDVNIYGLYVLDLLDLYKNLSESVEQSYKLSAISEKHLGSGKVAYEGTLDELFSKDLNKFIEYSKVDTELLFELNNKLGHIDLRFELIRICCTNWKASETSMGQVDPLILSYSKNMNKVCKNAYVKEEDLSKESLPGAYVKQGVGGLYGYVVDFDFTSLYPSIIRSCNIGPNTFIACLSNEKQSERLQLSDKEDKEIHYFNKIAYDWIYNRDKVPNDIRISFNPISDNRDFKIISKEKLEKFLIDNDAIITVSGSIFKGHDNETSFFNEILKYLMESRQKYKKLMQKAETEKNDRESKKLHLIQWAYKILSNSIYGVLGNRYFRMYHLDLARTITLTGQEVVKFAGFHLDDYLKTDTYKINSNFIYNYDNIKLKNVIYQDTDSLFVGIGDYLIDKGKLKL